MGDIEVALEIQDGSKVKKGVFFQKKK